MPADIQEIAQSGFDAQAADLARLAAIVPLHVLFEYRTGNGTISTSLGLDKAFRLVFVRVHFISGNVGTNPFDLDLVSVTDVKHNVKLISIAARGVNADVWESICTTRPQPADAPNPSPWTFNALDKIKFSWTQPAGAPVGWGLEVGLALAP